MKLHPKARTLIAVSMLVIGFVAYGFGTWLDFSVNPVGPGESAHWTDAFWPASFLGFPLVGAVIAARIPGNPIGWLLCGIGVSISISTFSSEYAQFALVTRDGTWPGGEVSAWLTSWSALVAAACLLALLIVFPSGSPRNSFWRWVLRGVVTVVGALIFFYATRPGPLDGIRDVVNPLGVDGLKAAADILTPILGFTLAVVLVAAVGDKIRVFLGSSGIERQQLKSFAIASLIFPTLFALTMVAEGLIGGDGSEGEFDPVVLVFFIGFNSLAAAIGLAVFKHRLYEIDVVVNRALVYGALTAILAGAYLSLVFGLQALLAPVTAESDLAIAASTLAVAALFRPIRSRLQSFIDRRFYRRKVDREKTIEEFNLRLRDEVDLEALSSRLIEVVSSTLQPAHLSLWIREST